ncbi:MAG TPA: methylated-DNA--[protein]-cysteine S-methyltransferase [Thermoanaerobaculia bacterium]|nr:methylated-DNA--[protein]-cysteine S-methyltransferase [Thermoanaerobaculia bacterium]
MIYRYLSSPIGTLLLARDAHGLAIVSFERGGRPSEPLDEWEREDDAFREEVCQFERYFAGTLRQFDLPLSASGTAFQKSVWMALRAIPYAETRSYGDIARVLGRPSACRAVGRANGANPLPIVVPCHRVIGSDGSFTGFAGGLGVKRYLLELEGGAASQRSLLPRASAVRSAASINLLLAME